MSTVQDVLVEKTNPHVHTIAETASVMDAVRAMNEGDGHRGAVHDERHAIRDEQGNIRQGQPIREPEGEPDFENCEVTDRNPCR